MIPNRYFFSPGVNGNSISTPNASHLNVTTGFEFIFKIQPLKWTYTGNKIIFSKYDSGSNQRGYQVQITTTGLLRLTLSEAGTTAVDYDSTVGMTGFSLNEPIWVKVDFDASINRARFFTAPNSIKVPTSWNQLGADKTTAITDIHQSTTALRIGANSLTTGQYMGRIFNLIIKDAIDGNVVFSKDFTNVEPETIIFDDDSSYGVELTIASTEIANYARIVGGINKGKIVYPREERTNATVRSQSAPTITKTATPFDGNKAATSVGLHTPIFCTASNVYVTEPYANNTTRLARLNKSLISQENVLVNSATLNGDAGHRGAAVAVASDGIVVTYPEGHANEWRGKHTTASEDLSTLTATTAPTGSGENSYRRMYRNPNDGAIWLVERGDGWYGYVRKWNTTTKSWDTKAGGRAIAGWGAAYANSIYGMDLAFASNGTIFMVLEWSDGGTGYPRRDVTVIKSTDGGDTWTTMTGGRLTTPLEPNIAHLALPSPQATRNAVQARIAVDSSNNPVVFAAYKRANDSRRSLYVSRWVPSEERFVYRKVHNFTSATNIGNPSLTYYNGTIYVLFSQFDEHDDANWTTNNPATPWATAAALHLYKTTDGGKTFDTCVLDDGTGIDKFYGGYFDPEALRLDTKLRMLPVCGSDFTVSEIWECTF